MTKRECFTAFSACAAFVILWLPRGAEAQVPGYRHPFGGQWTLRLDVSSASAGPLQGLQVPVAMDETSYNGRFEIDLAGDQLAPLFEPESQCDWGSAEFLGRFDWDPELKPLLEFVRISRGGEVRQSDCRFELRVLVKPDSSFVGWWCQGTWEDCRREGPAMLERR